MILANIHFTLIIVFLPQKNKWCGSILVLKYEDLIIILFLLASFEKDCPKGINRRSQKNAAIARDSCKNMLLSPVTDPDSLSCIPPTQSYVLC